MAERWITFPAQMGDHRAFITFDDGFSDIANSDPRAFSLEVRATIRHPDEAGLPGPGEFTALRAVDEELDAALTKEGAVYVGRVTVNGCRHFFFYVDMAEEPAGDIVAAIADRSGYELVYAYQEDAAKDDYWRKLYPTMDDWQVIRDLAVLEQLGKHNDIEQASRRIRHWASLPGKDAASDFSALLGEGGYEIIETTPEDDDRISICFSHHGSTGLVDITRHTIRLNRRIRAAEGDYQGWECAVVTEKASG